MENLLDKVPELIKLEGYAHDRSVFLNGEQLNPEYSLSIRNHSPSGFNWGYGGSGPAQLSLAVLLATCPAEIASKYYQSFKFNVIAGYDGGEDFKDEIRLRDKIKQYIDDRK